MFIHCFLMSFYRFASILLRILKFMLLRGNCPWFSSVVFVFDIHVKPASEISWKIMSCPSGNITLWLQPCGRGNLYSWLNLPDVKLPSHWVGRGEGEP